MKDLEWNLYMYGENPDTYLEMIGLFKNTGQLK